MTVNKDAEVGVEEPMPMAVAEPVVADAPEQPTTVTVVAPSAMPEGYNFTAQVNGKEFQVTVPPGGVTEGQQFEVPYPSFDTVTTGVKGHDDPLLGAPTGHWRYLCTECFGVFCNGLFWQGCCLTPLLLAQLTQRMGLGFCGHPQATRNEGVCRNIAMVWLLFLILLCCGIGGLMAIFVFIWLTILGMNLRYNMRKKYKIAPSCFECCDGTLDDFCCTFCGCQSCAAIQMARHTHDEDQYPYSCCSSTGLPPNAPQLHVV